MGLLSDLILFLVCIGAASVAVYGVLRMVLRQRELTSGDCKELRFYAACAGFGIVFPIWMVVSEVDASAIWWFVVLTPLMLWPTRRIRDIWSREIRAGMIAASPVPVNPPAGPLRGRQGVAAPARTLWRLGRL